MSIPVMVVFYDTTDAGGKELEADVRRSLIDDAGRFNLSDGWSFVAAYAPEATNTARVLYLRHESVPLDEALAAVEELQRH